MTAPDTFAARVAGADVHDIVEWPRLDPAAMHGVLGQFVEAAGPYSEADPVGILVSSMVLLGCAINRSPNVLAGNEKHTAALFACLVGRTAKARKGTAGSVARALMTYADPGFLTRIEGGFGSGEKLVDEVRDPAEDDDGAKDTRLCVWEAEFARVLTVASRDGSILGPIIRHGWDGLPLEARSRKTTVVASKAHLSVLGMVTIEELRRTLSDSDLYGGTANRFLFALVRRGDLHPDGGNVPANVLDLYGTKLGENVRKAGRTTVVTRTPEATQEWEQIYKRLAVDDPGGLLGAVIARDSAQTLRLSLTYALLDGSTVIDVEHIRAADALWSYCRDSAAYIFGNRLSDPIAERLLEALRKAGTAGIDRAAQSGALGGHITAARLDTATELLIRHGVAVRQQEETGGRPRDVLYYCERSERSGKRVSAQVRGPDFLREQRE